MCIKSQFVKLYKNTFSGTDNITIDNLYHKLLMCSELFHAFNCFSKLEEARKWELHITLGQTTKDGYDKETMLFENRQLPHLEYLIRSAVYRFENDWNHTVVCTDNNFNYISLMCANIHKDIRVINIGNFEINQNSFNNLLLSKSFWSRFHSEKILVYQQDADIYHGDLSKFIQYDYIGPPWPVDQKDNKHQVGNGGFSLRSKSKMLECLERVDPNELPLMEGTQQYMAGRAYLGKPMDAPPEDVYYSKTMIDFKIGNVSDRETALKFGNESSFRKNAIGAHQYWWYNKSLFFNNSCDYCDTPKLKNYTLADWEWVEGEAKHHVSGWPGVINTCKEHGVITKSREDHQTLLIDNLEKYFVWDNMPPVTREWVGITHTTPNTPPYLKIVDIDTLLTNQNFLKSLKHCKCIITLSKYMEQYIINILKKIPVLYLKHPTHTNNVQLFEKIHLDTIINRTDLAVVQLGQQLRHMSSIYQLNYPGKKIWLTGTSDLSKMQNLLEQECKWKEIKIDFDCVEMKYITDLEEYKDVIYNNIVLIDLIDASANNAILELTAAGIPYIVKKLPSIVEYIGHQYPLFFETLSDVEHLLANKDILADKLHEACNYLHTIDLSSISHDRFASELLKAANQ